MTDTRELDPFVLHPVAGVSAIDLVVEGVHCGACVATIEKGFAGQRGVREARVNLASKRVTVEWDDGEQTPQTILDRLQSLGYPAYPFAAERRDGVEAAYERRLLRCLAVAAAGTASLMLISGALWAMPQAHAAQAPLHALMAAIAVVTVAYAGMPFFENALRALRQRSINMDAPIALGVALTMALSLVAMVSGAETYFDSAPMLLAFLLAGRFLDQRMRARTRQVAADLAALRPARAVRLEENGEARDVAIAEVQPGDLVLSRAGERVPVDGVIEDGRSEIDQSFVTGETRPASVEAGAQVFAGAINLGGALRIRVRQAATGTLVDEVNALLEKAIEQRSSYVKLADHAARYYAPLVAATALAAFLGWAAFGPSWRQALEIAVAVLIITCPCALGLAVPAVQVVAAGAMFRRGVILNSGDALERLADVDTVVFDKTGTLTLPRPSLINADAASAEELALAGALALSSRHPLAAAVAAAAAAKTPMTAHEFPGQGVTALYQGKRIKLGSTAYCKAETEALAVAEAYPDASLIAFRGPERAVVFAATQAPRPDAAGTVAGLRKAGYAIEILSGDRARAVEAMAMALNVSKSSAELKPADKIAALKALKRQGRNVLMVGDGLNDAPALATADASMSPISATHLTQAQADAVFLGDRLGPVAEALALACKAKRLMIENLGLAAVYNLIAVPLALAGLATPLVAAVAMSGSSILVTLNALRARNA
jgi:Cu2+-exporting ATPase